MHFKQSLGKFSALRNEWREKFFECYAASLKDGIYAVTNTTVPNFKAYPIINFGKSIFILKGNSTTLFSYQNNDLKKKTLRVKKE